MTDLLIMFLSTIGALFILSTAIAMVRKRDVYLRINVTTKTATLGLGLILISAALFFSEYAVTTRVLVIIIFIILTAPIGGHMLARAAYLNKTPKWEGMKTDELEGHYGPDNELLHSEPPMHKTPPISPENDEKNP